MAKDLSLRAKLVTKLDKSKIPDSIDGLSGLQSLADEVQRWYDGFNTTDLMAIIGQTLDYIVQENFVQQGRPEKWAEWSDEWADRRSKPPYNKGGGQILQLFGNLRNSLNVSKITKNSVSLSTNVAYANRMNFGGGGVPARPFMIVPESDYDLFVTEILDFFNL